MLEQKDVTVAEHRLHDTVEMTLPALLDKIEALHRAAERLLNASNAGREAIGRVMALVGEHTVIAQWHEERPVFAERQAAAEALAEILGRESKP